MSQAEQIANPARESTLIRLGRVFPDDKKTKISFLVGTILVGGAVVEYLFGNALEQVFGLVGLAGIFYFRWVFLALMFTSEIVFHSISGSVHECELLVETCPENGDDGSGTSKKTVRKNLSVQDSDMSLARNLFVGVAAQLALLGSVIGISGAVRMISSTVKSVTAGPGEVLSTIGAAGAKMATAFATTELGCLVIIYVAIRSALIKLHIKRSIERLDDSTCVDSVESELDYNARSRFTACWPPSYEDGGADEDDES